MQIGLTIPLSRYLHISRLSYGSLCPRKFCWDLHRITLHGRGSLLAVHCETRYAFTLYDLAAADWNDLAAVFHRGIAESLANAGFGKPAIRRYLNEAGKPIFTKTHGRHEVAFLNRAWADVMRMDYALEPLEKSQPLLDHAVNAIPGRCAGFAGVAASLERMKVSLEG